MDKQGSQVSEERPIENFADAPQNNSLNRFYKKLLLLLIFCMLFLLVRTAVYLSGNVTSFIPNSAHFPTNVPYMRPTSFELPKSIPSMTIDPTISNVIGNTCQTNTDCVMKKKPYCCGETKEYINECYAKNEVPQDISCKGVESCPMLMQITSCICHSGKCIGS